MTHDELITGILNREGHTMWSDRAIALIQVLDGTDVDPTSPTLLDDMIAAQASQPAVAVWLDNLPGLSSGDRAKAEEQMGYLQMQITAVAVG